MAIFDGYVLQGPRVAPSNSAVSTEPDNGVIRDVRPLPASWTARGAGAPEVLDVWADQYRTAILRPEGEATTEYLIWAANNSQLALVNDTSWLIDQATTVPTVGTVTVGAYTDGTLRLVVTDSGGRSVAQVYAIAIAVGGVTYDDDGWDPANPLARLGTVPYPVYLPAVGDQNPLAGTVDLVDVPPTDFVTNILGGGFSVERGDRVVSVLYTVSPSTFWWTRNDAFDTRFGWDGSVQRWRPYRGSAPKDVGELLFDTDYKLLPRPNNLVIGTYLPGNTLLPDTYSMLRIGTTAGATSTPIAPNDGTFLGVLVVTDDEAESTYSFTGPAVNLSGVVGEKTGVLQFNPAYISQYAGLHVWYSYRGFRSDEQGFVGDIVTAASSPLFIAPIPGLTDNPFIRLGNRHPLTVTLVANEAALGVPAEGEAQVALSTGRLALAPADIDKADPNNAGFDKHYLGEGVYYDGVALNAIPQPTRAPVQLVGLNGSFTTVGASNALYVLDSTVFSSDTAALGAAYTPYRGLGSSGIINTPDGTGVLPYEVTTPANPSPVRVGGDTLPVNPPQPEAMGLVRRASVGTGDLIVFSNTGSVIAIQVVRYTDDVPANPNDVPGGTAVLAQEAVALGGGRRGSLIQLNTEDRTRFSGAKAYFLQAVVTPATYTTLARFISRRPGPYVFEGGEQLTYSRNGVNTTWTAPAGTLTAAQVATSIGVGAAALDDRVVLSASTRVEIGWEAPGATPAAPILGFLPGWAAVANTPNWLPDSGACMGLYRSSVNLDRSLADADYSATARLEDAVLQQSVQESPFVFFDRPPLEDVAGYDEGVFFNLRTTVTQQGSVQIVNKNLQHFVDIQHEFGARRFKWLASGSLTQQVQAVSTALSLGHTAVVPESLVAAVGGGLWVSSEGGPLVRQVEDVDYLLPNDGGPGFAQLITQYGVQLGYGALGTYTVGTDLFDVTDDVDFTTAVAAGDRLKIASGDAAGHYIVQQVPSAQRLQVRQLFPASSTRPESWEVFEGTDPSTTDYDHTLVADALYQEFSHLPAETFDVRVLSPLGVIDDASSPLQVFQADMAQALAVGRAISLRFGAVAPTAGTTATLTALARTDLGSVANNSLFVPAGAHFTDESFNIRLGTQTWVQGVNLLPVATEAAFSPDPGGGAGIEYAQDTRKLKFGSSILTDYEGSSVWYIETWLTGTLLLAGSALYNPDNGQVALGDADLTAHDGVMLYFVEQMIPQGQADVAISPLAGSVSFRQPRVVGQLVEFEYWLADANGRRVGTASDKTIEFLPLFVERETSLRLDNRRFLLNPVGTHVVDWAIEPIVFIGPTQQNYGTVDFTATASTAYPGAMLLTFTRDLPAWVDVIGTYGVFDALGGEQSYTASQRPIYRPPFYIKAGTDNFDIRGDRSGDFVAGQMLRLGADCIYIRSVVYYPTSDATKVYFFPPSTTELGSRSPGNDALALITTEPITTEVDPDGVPTLTTADAGFMLALDLTLHPFEPVPVGQNFMIFSGDLTRVVTPNNMVANVVVPGHILEVGGRPFTVVKAEQSDDGTRTKVTFSAPFRSSVSMPGVTVKASYRPVYPPDVREFVGVGPILDTEPVDVVLFDGGTTPGRSLRKSVEYEIDPTTGVISLLAPFQDALQAGQRLYAYFTQQRALAPFIRNQEVVVPRYKAEYLYGTLPSNENGTLGATLTGTFTFENPDSFYFRVLPLQEFMGEVSQAAVAEANAQEPSSGPMMAAPGGTDNWEQGRTGLKTQRRVLLDADRAARAFLDFYNQGVVGFEQVLEAITGVRIGDRDGKFRFFVGRGLDYAPPGYEDDLTGYLNALNAWAKVFDAQDPARDIYFDPSVDPLVLPTTCRMGVLPADPEGKLTGTPIPPSTLAGLIRSQKVVIQNDVDDLVLRGPGRASTRRITVYPYFISQRLGVFTDLSTPSRLSRLFPTEARAFFTLMPGALADVENGDPGVYTYGRVNPDTGETESTYGTQIGAVANPVLGVIGNLTEKNLRRRLARTRVWQYFPQGLAAGTFQAAPPIPAANITEPCMVVSQVPLDEFPLNTEGWPDVAQLLSQGGDVPDAEAGDPEMSLPGFVTGDQIAFGKPDGTTYTAYYRDLLDVYGVPGFPGVFVYDVQYGCILRFQGGDPLVAPATDPGLLLIGTGPVTGIPWDEFAIDPEDTLYATPPTAVAADPLGGGPTLPATAAVIQQAGAMSPTYRNGTDMLVQADGTIIDKTLPSWADPAFFGLKELLGQNVPEPMSHLEGTVSFTYTDTDPVNIPALSGEALDDSGDHQIPYLKASGTEMERLGQVHNVFGTVFEYPDEILALDGYVLGAATATEPPATLLSATNFTAPADPAQAGDLLLVQNTPAEAGYEGILTVAALSWDGTHTRIEHPRFATQTTPPQVGNQTNSPMRYKLWNYSVVTTPGLYPTNPQVTPGLYGAVLADDYTNKQLIISMQSLVVAGIDFVLNNEQAPADGNLNDIWSHTAGGLGDTNAIVLHFLYRRDDDIDPLTWPVGAPAYGNEVLRLVIRRNDFDVVCQGVTNTYAHTGVVLFGTFIAGTVPGEVFPGTFADLRHIVINYNPALPSVLPFNAVAGQEDHWYLPYQPLAAPARNVGLYPYEFAIDIFTSAGFSTVNPESNTAWCDPDRLTFHEVVDFRQARPRGYQHPDPAGAQTVYQTSLDIDALTLNGAFDTALPALYNGGTAFTFLPRTPSTTHLPGTMSWTPGLVENGWLKAMGFEGLVNDPITATGRTVAVTASTDTVGGNPIGAGNGVAQYNRILNDPADIDEDLIQKGDLVLIDQADTTLADWATGKAGTYLLRYYQPPDMPNPYHTCAPDAQLTFPTVLSFTAATRTLVVDDSAPLPANGMVFIALDVGALGVNDLATFRQGVVYGGFTAVHVGDTYVLVLAVGPGWPYWADDTALTPAEILALETSAVGKQIGWLDAGGINPLPVTFRGGVLPDDSSVVGYHFAFGVIEGLGHLNIQSPYNNLVFSTPLGIVPGAPGLGVIQPVAGAVQANEAFDPTNDVPVYDHVVRTLNIRLNAADPATQALNDPHGLAAAVPGFMHMVVLPGYRITADDGAGTPGFYAQGGLFIEPSVPQSWAGLGGLPNLVDRSHTFFPTLVGMYDAATQEAVHYEVRRIRRFHAVQADLRSDLYPLRFAYEIRYGTVTSYTVNPQQTAILEATGGTQLGLFDDPDVNINPGDMMRVLDSTGRVVDTAYLADVMSGTQLRLRAPGFTKVALAGGETFQVFLRTAPVPQEQSYEQLLELIMTETYRTVADRSDPDPANWAGGYVPEVLAAAPWSTIANILYDDTVPDFTALDIQKGDFVVVDPAGLLPAPVGERGAWPMGGLGTSSRAQFDPGPVSPLDDNRGFYRVTKVAADHLEVVGLSLFTGEEGADVVFAAGDADIEYTIYPCVQSILSLSAVEGQNDLRPTARPRNDSYIDPLDPIFTAHSMRPFSYRVLRPTSMVTREMVETVLAFRERMLSLIEFLAFAQAGGFYWDFQSEEHIQDIGNPANLFSNPGLLSNYKLAEIIGNLDVAPFLNTRGCLSLLDRRFWVRDSRLDTLGPMVGDPYRYQTPPAGAFPAANGPYTAYTDTQGMLVRPLLPDYVSLVLDKRDQLRLSRFAWLAYRVTQDKGTLARIRRFDAELPKRLEEKRRALLVQKSTGGM